MNPDPGYKLLLLFLWGALCEESNSQQKKIYIYCRDPPFPYVFLVYDEALMVSNCVI